jgi:enoyl-CoA hydratase/carnithine racemase
MPAYLLDLVTPKDREKLIQSELTDGVRPLTLDRPEALNAFNADQFGACGV